MVPKAGVMGAVINVGAAKEVEAGVNEGAEYVVVAAGTGLGRVEYEVTDVTGALATGGGTKLGAE